MITALRSRAELELDRLALDPYCKLYLPFWKLDGDSFADHSAYGHLCTNYGSKWQLDGRYFDGDDDKVDCGNHPSLQITSTDPFTMFSEFNPSSLTSMDTLIGKDGGGGTVNKWIFCYEDATKGAGLHINSPANEAFWFDSYWVPVIHKRQQVALTREQSNWLFYGDGKQVKTLTSTQVMRNSTTSLIVGWSESTFYWHGLISQTLIHSFADYAPRILSRSIGG